MRALSCLLAAASAFTLAACAASGESPNQSPVPVSYGQVDMEEYIMAAVASPARPEADVARDEARKPAEVVAFSGLQRGDVVAELAPGGGYYTRILAQAVGPEGKVYALFPAFFANRPGALDPINAVAAQYGNVEVLVVDSYDTMTLPEPVDLVWTTENYHDFANGNIAATNASVFNALRPEQVEAARASVANWTAQPIDPDANEVEVPASWQGASTETASVDMSKAIRNIQGILNNNGFDAGAPDGVMGKKTVAAIKQFQASIGMEPTGEIDDKLVRELLARNG